MEPTAGRAFFSGRLIHIIKKLSTVLSTKPVFLWIKSNKRSIYEQYTQIRVDRYHSYRAIQILYVFT